MTHANTIVQGVMGEMVVCAICRTAGEMVSVLNVCLDSVGAQLVVGFQRINHIEVFPVVWNAVTCGISHLIFCGVFLYVFSFKGYGCFHIVFLDLVLQHQLGTHHFGCEIVSGMLEVGPYAEVFGSLGLVEPILSLYVIFLLFLGVESASEK